MSGPFRCLLCRRASAFRERFRGTGLPGVRLCARCFGLSCTVLLAIVAAQVGLICAAAMREWERWWLLAGAFFLYNWGGLAVHELGHVLGGVLGGFRILEIRVGGSPLITARIGGTRVHVGFGLGSDPVGGWVQTGHPGRPTAARVALLLSGGALMDMLAAVAWGWVAFRGFFPAAWPLVLHFSTALRSLDRPKDRPTDRKLWEAFRADPERGLERIGEVYYVMRSAFACERGRNDEALAWAQRGLERYAGSAWIELQRASLLGESGRGEEAVAAYEGLLERSAMEPALLALAHNNFAWVLIEAGRLLEAETHSARSLEIDPMAPHALGTRGCLLVRLGKPREALPFLEEAFDFNESDRVRAIDAAFLAMARAALGDRKRASRWLRGSRRLDRRCNYLDEARRAVESGA